MRLHEAIGCVTSDGEHDGHGDAVGAHNAVTMGTVSVGKTFLATALGQAVVPRHDGVNFERTNTAMDRTDRLRVDALTAADRCRPLPTASTSQSRTSKQPSPEPPFPI